MISTDFEYKPLRRVNPQKLANYLREHPDRELVKYLVDRYTNGFMLGMERELLGNMPCENSKEVRRNPDIAQALVDKEVQLGHMLGPFDLDKPPLKNLVYSSINIIPKINSKDLWHLIHDLAHPYDHATSVNSCIPEEKIFSAVPLH